MTIVAVVVEATGDPSRMACLRWYITSRDDYYAHLREIGAAYREVIGGH